MLLDSGFNVDVVRDPVERARHLNYESYTAIVGPGDPLVDQVADAGLAWRDLAFCAISHLHLDHTGGLRLLAGGPPVVLQEAEWEFGSGLTFEEALENAFFRTDYGRPGLTIETLDGDTELAPGLRALDTRGHTPGHRRSRSTCRGTARWCSPATRPTCCGTSSSRWPAGRPPRPTWWNRPGRPPGGCTSCGRRGPWCCRGTTRTPGGHCRPTWTKPLPGSRRAVF